MGSPSKEDAPSENNSVVAVAEEKPYFTRRPEPWTGVDEYLERYAHRLNGGGNRYSNTEEFDIIEIDDLVDENEGTSRVMIRETIKASQLNEWLEKTDETIYSDHTGKKRQPKLRLLVHATEPTSNGRTVSFDGLDTTHRVTESLNMPRSYWYRTVSDGDNSVFAHEPRQLAHGEKPKHVTLHIVSYARYDLSLGVGYSEISGCVSGFVNLRSRTNLELEALEQMKEYAEDIMLTPLIISLCAMEYADDNTGELEAKMSDVVGAMNIVDPPLNNRAEANLYVNKQATRDAVLSIMMDSNSNLLDEQTQAVLKLGIDIGNLFLKYPDSPFSTIAHSLYETADVIIKRRENYARNLDIYLQVREATAAAREDTRLALRDSSQMKAIALVTMIFLPATALATIFSMQTFFTQTDADNFIVSHHFWIFWAIAIPITAMVVIFYVSWIQRKEAKEFLNKRLPHIAKLLKIYEEPKDSNDDNNGSNNDDSEKGSILEKVETASIRSRARLSRKSLILDEEAAQMK